MTASCGHPLCELITGPCSLTAGRSRGCTPGLTPREITAEVFDEARALVEAIDLDDPKTRPAAVRLAEIIRREARDDRNLVALARDEEPELATALSRLCQRQK